MTAGVESCSCDLHGKSEKPNLPWLPKKVRFNVSGFDGQAKANARKIPSLLPLTLASPSSFDVQGHRQLKVLHRDHRQLKLGTSSYRNHRQVKMLHLDHLQQIKMTQSDKMPRVIHLIMMMMLKQCKPRSELIRK